MAVSMNIIDELQWRALIHQCTDLAAVTKELESSTVLYEGFDRIEEWGQPAIYGDGLVFSLSYPQ